MMNQDGGACKGTPVEKLNRLACDSQTPQAATGTNSLDLDIAEVKRDLEEYNDIPEAYLSTLPGRLHLFFSNSPETTFFLA